MEGIDGVTATVDQLVRRQIDIVRMATRMQDKTAAYKFVETQLFLAKKSAVETIVAGEGIDTNKILGKLIVSIAEDMSAAGLDAKNATKIQKDEISTRLKEAINKAKKSAVKAIKRKIR